MSERRTRRRIRRPGQSIKSPEERTAVAKPGDTRSKWKKKQAMINAVEKTRGLINLACRQAQISERTHRHWMVHDPEYAERVQDAIMIGKDMIEFRLLQKCEEGDVQALRLYLSARCKERGYGIDRLEQSGVNGSPIRVDCNSPTIEELIKSSGPEELASMMGKVRKNAGRIDSRTTRN